MGFKRKKATTPKSHVPEDTRTDVSLLNYSIPHSLNLNLDNTTSKFLPSSSTTLAKQSIKQVRIAGVSEKRFLTATLTITLDDNFLGMQLIYGGKSEQSLSR